MCVYNKTYLGERQLAAKCSFAPNEELISVKQIDGTVITFLKIS